VESFNVGCDFDFASYGTSDALCQCATVPVQPTPLPGSPTSKPTFTPTPAPTRTPVVVTSVGLSGITCTEFDADIFESGMDTTIGEGDATFDEILCADDSSAVTITTEVTVDLAIALANPSATNVMEHIIDTLDASTLETNIIAAASSRRRLGGRRRLGMESISVASVGVSTFAPSAAPTPSPTAVPIPSPTAKPTLPPTALPISAPTIAKKRKVSRGGMSSRDTVILVVLACFIAILSVTAVVILKINTKPKAPATALAPVVSADAAFTAVPLNAPTESATGVQLGVVSAQKDGTSKLTL